MLIGIPVLVLLATSGNNGTREPQVVAASHLGFHRGGAIARYRVVGATEM